MTPSLSGAPRQFCLQPALTRVQVIPPVLPRPFRQVCIRVKPRIGLPHPLQRGAGVFAEVFVVFRQFNERVEMPARSGLFPQGARGLQIAAPFLQNREPLYRLPEIGLGEIALQTAFIEPGGIVWQVQVF